MRVPFTLSDQSITVFVDGKVRTVLSGNVNFDKLKQHLKGAEHDVDTIIKLSDREEAIRQSSVGSKVTVKDGTVYYEGEEVRNSLTTKLLNLLDEGFDATPWVKFLEKLMTNPSYRSRECLYQFLDHFNAPITPEGNFIAFKRVGKYYKDLHSGTFDNSVGVTVKMDRAMVDDDPQRTCSAGLHVCADEYLKGYAIGNRTMVVEVSPANVVAVPYDYNFSKMRVCEYTVVAELADAEQDIPKVLSQQVYTKPAQQRDAKGRFLKKG